MKRGPAELSIKNHRRYDNNLFKVVEAEFNIPVARKVSLRAIPRQSSNTHLKM